MKIEEAEIIQPEDIRIVRAALSGTHISEKDLRRLSCLNFLSGFRREKNRIYPIVNMRAWRYALWHKKYGEQLLEHP